MKRWTAGAVCLMLALTIVFSSVGFNTADVKAATVSKDAKTYEIAIAFDNSGSMYTSAAWCRAKYAMEIFASMLNYENGDVLKIFPMWEVTVDGSQTGGSYAPIEIRSGADIDRISNIYTVCPGDTPLSPVIEAHRALMSSSATDKWLIVLSDGSFNLRNRDDKEYSAINAQSELEALSSERIKVQYLAIGKADKVEQKPEKFLFSKMSNESSLKQDLVDICNTIFERSPLPYEYINAANITLDISMRSVIVFTQGEGAKINGLKDENGEPVGVKLDSGQRTYSNIIAGVGSDGEVEYTQAPIDYTLAGQVVTFDACKKGTYTLDCTGMENIQIFYEPDVDIKVAMRDKNGNEVDLAAESIYPGEYTVEYEIVDAQTGDDITASKLMGSEVSLTGYIKTSDGVETPFENGGTVSLAADESTKIIVRGKYLGDYSISNEGADNMPEFNVEPPKEQKFKVKAKSEQFDSWFQKSKIERWKPVRLEFSLDKNPLTDEQMARVITNITFSDEIAHRAELVPGQSAIDVYLGQNGDGGYESVESGSYKLTAQMSYTDEYGRVLTDTDNFTAKVKAYPWYIKWIVLFLILAAIAGLIVFILTRKAWPVRVYFDGAFGSESLSYKNGRMELLSNSHDGVLSAEVAKSSILLKCRKEQAELKILNVTPRYNVTKFSIDGVEYTLRKGDGKYVDSSGQEAKDIIISGQTAIRAVTSDEVIRGDLYINSDPELIR